LSTSRRRLAAGRRTAVAGALNKDINYRVYARWLHENAAELSDGDQRTMAGVVWALAFGSTGRRARAIWSIFRATFSAAASRSLAAHTRESRATTSSLDGTAITGNGHGFQLQAFYDRIHRSNSANAPKFHIDTYDVDFQDSLGLGGRHELVWGGGARVAHYQIGTVPSRSTRVAAICSSAICSSRTASRSLRQ